jgi:hypothetical protein
MPLVALNLDQARSAYSALELRTAAAESHVSVLQATVDTLNAAQSTLVDRANLLTEFTVIHAQANAQLVADQVNQISPDAQLNRFVAALGMAAALAEASMPDRTIDAVTASVQMYLTFGTAPDGSSSIGVRLYQPELGVPAALATTSFEMKKVPPQPGVPAPVSLYSVLQRKQAAYTQAFWGQFASAAPPSHPAADIVATIGITLSNVGVWSFPFLVQQASAIAAAETILASRAAETAPSGATAAYSAAVAALASATAGFTAADPTLAVAGDLYALAAVLDASTRRAEGVLP